MRPALILAALLAVATTAATENHSVVHEVDLEHRYQKIDHFGASDCWTTRILSKWSKEKRERVADLLFSREKGIGLSLWRFNLGAGLQPGRITDPLRTTESFETAKGRYDWSRMKAERAMLLAAKARGVARFHAFSLSGTPRMTRNGFVNADAGRHTTNLRRDAEADYTAYLADVVEHFARGYPEQEQVVFAPSTNRSGIGTAAPTRVRGGRTPTSSASPCCSRRRWRNASSPRAFTSRNRAASRT